jgi:hypothetical protein
MNGSKSRATTRIGCAGIASFASLAVALPAGAATLALPIVDGARDPEYGPARAVQSIDTGFGDNQSELDAGYALVREGRLYLMLAGNVQNNFNKLEIFIDTQAGGENKLTAAGLPDSEGSVDNLAGLRFDSAFAPDRYVFVRRGAGKFDIDYVVLGVAGSFSSYQNVFGGTDFGSGATGTGANAKPIEIAYNGSNGGGVGGNTGQPADQTAAGAVMTGLELSIALTDLGVTGSSLKIATFQNNQDHNYLSNQSLAGLPNFTGNLGGDGGGGFTGNLSGIDFNNYAGDQFFSVDVPEPAGIGAIASSLLIAAYRRRGREVAR